MSRTFLALAGLTLGMTVTFAPPSTLGAQEPQSYSPAQLRQLGQQTLQRIVARHGRSEDEALRREIGGIIDSIRIAAEYQAHPVVWELINDESLNAAAAPGGVMIINIGLPMFCREYGRSESGGDAARATRKYLGCVAAVIGHEFGHLALGHSDSVGATIQRRREIADRSDRAESVEGAVMDSLLMHGLRIERNRELAADRAGALYMLRAGLEVQDAIDLFTAMDSVERTARDWRGNLTWLRGHPRSAERAALLEAHRAQLKLNQRDFDDALALIEHDIMPDSALALLDRVIADFPWLPAAQHARAVVLARKWMAATPTRTLRVRPSMPVYDARFITSVRGAADQASALREARAAFQKAFELDRHPYTLANMAVLDAYAGDAALARQRAEQAASLLGNDPDVLNNLGVVHFLANRNREAFDAFSRAERLAGRELTPTIAFNVARGAAAIGDSTRAIQLLARYVAYDGRSVWGREAAQLHRTLAGEQVAQQGGSPATGLDDAPSIAGVRLGSRMGQVLGVLGEPPQSEDNAAGRLIRYPARGLALLVDPTSGVQLILLENRASGSVEEVSVGDDVAGAISKLGAPVDRARRGATGEMLAFDRGSWAIVLVAEGGVVRALSIRTIQE